jgi:hypothetical protein
MIAFPKEASFARPGCVSKSFGVFICEELCEPFGSPK